MSTFNRTFSVKNGIDVANTIIVDSNRNVSNVNISSALINVTTANIGTIENAQLDAVILAAAAGANTVRVSENGTGTLNQVSLNFTDSSNVEVVVSPNINGNADITFDLADVSFSAGGAGSYGGATEVPQLVVDEKGRITAISNVSIGGGTVTQVNTGLGLTGGPITTDGTISANIASTTVQGITKLVNSVSSTDSANAATASSVKTAYDQATSAWGAANVKVETISSGEGIAVSDSGSAPNVGKTITANVATTSVRGITKLVNSVSSTDSANAATASSVKTAYDTAAAGYGQANAAYGQANLAFLSANSAANTTSVSQNGAGTLYKRSLNFVNTASILAFVEDGGAGVANVYFTTSGVSAGDALAVAQSAYDQANGAYDQANDAYTQANTAWTVANTKVETISSGLGIAVTDSGSSPNVGKTITANVASTTVQGITKLIDSVSSTDTANAATANSVKWVYDHADTKVALNAPNQTITGNLLITDNLEVQGNIFLSGNTTYINVTSLNVSDPIIYLAANNEVDDIVDIGFVGGRNNNGTYAHTGLIRHASDDVFYLFDNYEPEPENNVIDVEHVSFALATLRANINASSILIEGSPVALAGDTTNAYIQANAAFTRANVANAQANLAYAQANTAWSVANIKVETITTGLGLSSSSSSAAPNVGITLTSNVATTSTQGITKLIDAINSTDTGNAATANAVTWLGTTKVSKTGDTMTGKLTINVSGEGLEVAQANVSANIKVDQLFVKTSTLTTTSTSQVTLDSWSATEYTSAKYWVQMKQGSKVHTTEVLVVHDGTNSYVTEYGSIQSNESLGTLAASDVTGGVINLLITPAAGTSTTFKAVRYGVV